MVDNIDKEIEALEKQRDEEEKAWDEKIAALEKANKELDEQIEKEEALDAIARARQTKTMVYKDGRFQYIRDTEAISEAKKNLDKIQREQQLREEVERLEKLKEEALANIDEQIEGWEKYKEQWGSVVSEYKKKQDLLLIEQQLGIKLEGENWKDRLDQLEDFVKDYEALMDRLNNIKFEPPVIESGGGGNGGFISGSQTGGNIGSVIGGVIGGPTGGLAGGAIGNIIGGVIGGITGGSSSSSGGNHWTADKNGNAPSGAKPGDIVHTNGGDYVVVKPGTPGASYNPNNDKWSKPVKKNAKGTKFFSGGLSMVGENGPELRVLNRGDGILPNNITSNLWEWGSISPSDVMRDFAGINNSTDQGTNIVIQNFNPNLSSVKDGADFARYMRDNFSRAVIQTAGRRG